MKLIFIPVLCLLSTVVFLTYAGSVEKKNDLVPLLLSGPTTASKTTQLRIFTINKGKMNVFLDAWMKGVYPLRLKHGFKVEGVWTVRDKNKFVWLLSYDGPEGFEKKDSAYYASTSRKIMDPDPAQYIADTEYYFLDSAVGDQ